MDKKIIIETFEKLEENDSDFNLTLTKAIEENCENKYEKASLLLGIIGLKSQKSLKVMLDAMTEFLNGGVK